MYWNNIWWKWCEKNLTKTRRHRHLSRSPMFNERENEFTFEVFSSVVLDVCLRFSHYSLINIIVIIIIIVSIIMIVIVVFVRQDFVSIHNFNKHHSKLFVIFSSVCMCVRGAFIYKLNSAIVRYFLFSISLCLDVCLSLFQIIFDRFYVEKLHWWQRQTNIDTIHTYTHKTAYI